MIDADIPPLLIVDNDHAFLELVQTEPTALMSAPLVATSPETAEHSLRPGVSGIFQSAIARHGSLGLVVFIEPRGHAALLSLRRGQIPPIATERLERITVHGASSR